MKLLTLDILLQIRLPSLLEIFAYLVRLPNEFVLIWQIWPLCLISVSMRLQLISKYDFAFS
jgi:hypothetical protein